jgi:acyl carrier protein
MESESKGPRLVLPLTLTEKKLAEIWGSILSVPRIGVYDNFVELGGHSILAIQCLNRVRSAFGIDLPPTVFFTETANVREIAALIDKLSPSDRGTLRIPERLTTDVD